MNKRKTTSIALAAAVAISTVQLAYPANVFAQENVTKVTTSSKNVLTNEGTKENPWDISAEGVGNDVKAYLEQNNKDNSNPTYTLTISGSGKMKDFNVKWAPFSVDVPWNEYREMINEIIVGENITYIGKHSFRNIGITGGGMVNVKLPDSLEGIGDSAFHTTKVNVEIPANVQNIGVTSFCGEFNVSVNEGNACFESDDNVIYTKGKTEIIQASKFIGGNETFVVPATVKNIHSYSFSAVDIKVIDFSKARNLKNIDSYAFAETNIDKVKFPERFDGLNVGKDAFQKKSFTIEPSIFNGVLEIGNGSFEGNNNLTNLTINGEGKTKILSSAFKSCSKLKSVSLINTYLIEGSAFGGLQNVETVYITGAPEVKNNAFKENSDLTIYCENEKTVGSLKGIIDELKTNITIVNLNEGELKSSDLENSYHNKFIVPEKKGYKFAGWYTKNGTDNNDWGEEVTGEIKTGNTYYAKWDEVVATVEGVEYADLQTAIDNAKGKIIEIKDDIILKEPINIKEDDITINFNDKNISMENSNSESDLIKIDGAKGINIVNAKFASSGGRAISASGGAEITVKDSNFSKTDEGTTKGAISVEDATLKIEGNVNSKVEGKEETFPLIELNDKSNIELEENSSINGHELPNIGESNSGNASNDIIGNNTKLENILEHITVENLVEASSTDSIKIKKWTGVSNKNFYGIVKKANVTARKLLAKSQIEPIGGWKDVSNSESVTFAGLSAGTEYEIYVATDVNGTDAMKIASVKTESNSSPSGGGNYIPSKPTYTHEKIEGLDRYETAAKIADKLGSYDNVVLVNASFTMSDGLSASGLAGKENGAILLTKKDSIPKVTMDRIKKVKKVYIIGGESAISAKVANEITAAGVKVERIGGKTRVETSELVAKKIGNYSNAFVVNGFKGESDAMSASSIAARYEAPILLTNGKTSTHDKKTGVSYYVVGGNSVVNNEVVKKYNAKRLAGDDRYETNREVIDEFYSSSDKLYIANGETLVDALTASTIAKDNGIVLVNKKSDNSVLKNKNTVQVGGMNFEIDFEK